MKENCTSDEQDSLGGTKKEPGERIFVSPKSKIPIQLSRNKGRIVRRYSFELRLTRPPAVSLHWGFPNEGLEQDIFALDTTVHRTSHMTLQSNK